MSQRNKLRDLWAETRTVLVVHRSICFLDQKCY